MTFAPEIIEPAPSLSDSYPDVQVFQQAQSGTRAPVMTPQIPQIPQQIIYPGAPSSFSMNIASQPSFPNPVPNLSSAHSSKCSNCSGSRQVVSPTASVPRNFGAPNPAIGNYNAPQASLGISNGPPCPMQAGIGNVQSSIPPVSLPGPFGRSQRAEPMWRDHSLDSFERTPMPPPMQRSAPSGPASFNPMIPNIGQYEMLDLNQKPLNPGPPPMRYPVSAPNYMNNAGPQPISVHGSYGMGGQGVSNGPPPPQPIIPFTGPFNQPFPGSVVPLPPPRTAYATAPKFPPGAPKPKEDTDLATQLGYLSINFENGTNSATSKLTSQYLQEMYDDLNVLAGQISVATKPFDTTATVVTQFAQRYNLKHPSEWCLSIRTHSCTSPFPFSTQILIV